jgi:hypothetical protein
MDRSNKILVVNLRTICEMDGKCGKREREEKCMQGSCGENPTERGNLEELGLDGCTVLKWVKDIWGGMVWTGYIWLISQTFGCGGRLWL